MLPIEWSNLCSSDILCVAGLTQLDRLGFPTCLHHLMQSAVLLTLLTAVLTTGKSWSCSGKMTTITR